MVDPSALRLGGAMGLSPNLNIPQIYVESVEQAESGSFLYRFVCHPGGALIELTTNVGPAPNATDKAPPLVWRLLN